jgi:hypothetical protein
MCSSTCIRSRTRPVRGSSVPVISGGGGGGSGTVTSVTSANNSIAVATTTTTPVLTVGTVDKLFTNHAPAASLAMNTQKLTGLAAGSTAGDSVRFEQVSPAWASFNPATTGITGESVGLASYVQVGNVVYFILSTSGTGSTTARTFTLPVSTGANGAQYVGLASYIKDGGTTLTSPSACALANNSTTATLFKTMAQSAGSWTGSGAWQIVLVMFYGTN